MHKNLSMMDFAIKDPRSIPAMLRGTGNGCEKVWLRFEQQHTEITDLAVLIDLFTREARYGRVGTENDGMNQLQKYWWFVVVTLLILA